MAIRIASSHNLPWLLAGYFNDILFSHEKSGRSVDTKSVFPRETSFHPLLFLKPNPFYRDFQYKIGRCKR